MGQSWSGIRKLLEEDLLCEALRGRVQYFITKYNNAHDESGRVAVRVDGVEVLKGNEFIYYRDYLPLENALKKELGAPRRTWKDPIVRMLAILDRRVGKRTLHRLEQ